MIKLCDDGQPRQQLVFLGFKTARTVCKALIEILRQDIGRFKDE